MIILHIPGEPNDPTEAAAFRERLWRSIDDLLASISDGGVRIAFENMIRDNVPLLRDVMLRYSPDRIGICYDAGHGNIQPNEGLRDLETLRDRLISVHLHDNDGTGDQHLPLFDGTVDWPRLADIIARSSYTKAPNLEVAMRGTRIDDEAAFLRHTREGATRFANMLETARRHERTG